MEHHIEVEVLEGGKMPVKAHESDACWDVFVREIIHKPTHIRYKLGFKTKIPEGWEGELLPRSSISNYHLQLCNSIGTIDQGYRGEWEARFNLAPPNYLYYRNRNLNYPSEDEGFKFKLYEVGDCCAQIKFVRSEEEVKLINVELVTADTDRGEDGHGSTGK